MCRWRGIDGSEAGITLLRPVLQCAGCAAFFAARQRGHRSLEHEPKVSLQFHARLLWARNLPAGRQQYGVEMASKNGGGGRANRPTITDQEALLFHSQGRPGKLEVVATKPMATQRDLSLAYSPGVAVPVLAIAEDESKAYDYTTKGNFVAVITNGTAILGLGNRGALAAKPVMEGKAVLFKRFADVDSIDLEVSTEDPDEFINCVKVLGKSWGGINLEDIKAPECFII